MPHKDNLLLKLFSDLCINIFRNTLFKPNRATVKCPNRNATFFFFRRKP